MNDCVGRDIDGRPLRVGDEVVVLYADGDWSGIVGQVAKVTGTADFGYLDIEITLQCGQVGDTLAKDLRKLHNDHRPADESFGEVMAGLSQGNASEGIRRLLREGER